MAAGVSSDVTKGSKAPDVLVVNGALQRLAADLHERHKGGGPMFEMLRRLDSDGDGLLDRAELQKASHYHLISLINDR